ncbi:glycosyltransferase family 2 protein [Azoarcus sp. PA01]|nr:glycosyltransferase family 2 protein [Azoarcus sp. PA01]
MPRLDLRDPRPDASAFLASAPLPHRPSPTLPKLSVVIPLYNESGSLGELHARLAALLETLPLAGHEIIFIDDGSRDATFAEVAALCEIDPALRAIRFARNFGKEAAMAAGLRAATGEVVVLMDGDLQHPPELIPEMLARWRAGAKMVTAVRCSRDTDTWLRRQLSRGFYGLFKRVSEVALAEGGGDFRLFDHAVVRAINSMPERTRFMKGITSWVGFRQEEIPFDPAERAAGASAWSLLRLLNYAWDGLSAFSTLPLRVWSLVGLVMAAISGLYGGWLVVRTILWGIDVPGYTSLMVAVLFLSGIQLISLGVLGEYVGRIFTEVKARPLYLVAEKLGFDEDAP